MSNLLDFDTIVSKEGYQCIAGVDEAGRGPLAGPVVAAACIIARGVEIAFVDDSKALDDQTREELFQILTQHPDVLYGVGIIEADIIDKKNILQATFDAMRLAVDSLQQKPDYLLIDGKFIPSMEIPSEGIIKGDSRSQSIAAASIIAKVTRDRIMRKLHARWPEYGFDMHKGYGTLEHMAAIKKFGLIPGIHRKSFEPLKNMLLPDFFNETVKINGAGYGA